MILIKVREMTDYPQADFYDAVAKSQFAAFNPHVKTALAEWSDQRSTQTRPTVIDLGAGTGLSTLTTAEALPNADITACEPEFALRSALMTRTISQNLHDRVTIRDWSTLQLVESCTEKVDAVIALNMVVHLDASARSALLQWAARNLSPDGIVVIGPLPDGTSSRLNEGQIPVDMVFADDTVGRLRYHGTATSEPGTDDTTLWHMTWKIFEDDEILTCRQKTFVTFDITAGCLISEASAYGFRGVHVAGDLVLLRPAHTLR